jgi:hypothetical protein
MKIFTFLLIVLLSTKAFPQGIKSNVEFVGNKVQILQANTKLIFASGKLSSGDIIKTGCGNGVCYFRIEYKGRVLEQIVGEDITKMTIYEFDFGGDGDKEIVVVNDYNQTSFIFIYSYSRGMIQKLFEKEIMNYRTVLKIDYIEFYMQSGLAQIWHLFKGQFWEMKPVDNTKFKFK